MSVKIKSAPQKAPISPDSNQSLKQLNKALQIAEDKLVLLQAEKSRIENELSKSEVYSKFDVLASFQSELDKINSQIYQSNENWEKLALEIDELETKF